MEQKEWNNDFWEEAAKCAKRNRHTGCGTAFIIALLFAIACIAAAYA